MPIFMDRHDVSENVSAELLAQIHQEDLKIEHEYGCRGFTYWFDERRQNAFCLIEAPNKAAIESMHRHAHGDVPNTIIEVEPTIVESFLGRISDPEKSENTQLNIIKDSAHRILMTVKNLRIINNQDSNITQSISTDFEVAIKNLIKEQEGNIVNNTSHTYLISFKSADKAINTALKIETELKPKYTDASSRTKIGIASGDPVTDMPQIFEETIILTTRLSEVINSAINISFEVKMLYENEQRHPISVKHEIRVLSPSEETFLTQVMDEIENTWQNPEFNIDRFSDNLGFSKSQLYRKLKALTGKSPNAFIRDYRLDRALKLIDNQKGNISEIAFETGFNSLGYFSKCFKNKYNTIPSQYAQQKTP
ncbi:DUF4242 domain-containing protein [Aestuariibaculum sp. YM273]|uniref:nickel-binding protein n=1 Tax=Aestuariibaculum sp. YM273 TaxID=3070659 RepID=UPI0027DBACA0|nr:nickel-binding protein [Aestuariibaculum sp. YM273]WMI66137.1 DUF4242 domain-containing protein [Aestuariibaculum sp. YM273]